MLPPFVAFDFQTSFKGQHEFWQLMIFLEFQSDSTLAPTNLLLEQGQKFYQGWENTMLPLKFQSSFFVSSLEHEAPWKWVGFWNGSSRYLSVLLWNTRALCNLSWFRVVRDVNITFAYRLKTAMLYLVLKIKVKTHSSECGNLTTIPIKIHAQLSAPSCSLWQVMVKQYYTLTHHENKNKNKGSSHFAPWKRA